MLELVCPKCRGTLALVDDDLLCARCSARFPVLHGVPRLTDPDFYWGEMEQSEARSLMDEAARIGWKAAVAQQFSDKDAAWISMLDWQRASWTPFLDLARESVVLDIGSGYGAITHSLAIQYAEVHSIEAIRERVEFTRIRIEQEGLNNVRLVQGSALNLPYPPGSFDAIVVNGVLEWIGDWDVEGDPRSAQVRFLRRVHELLKPTGRLVVGIENRTGYGSFRGSRDHSGLPLTNLLPRALATAALRCFATKHHRMKAPPRTYRTYTYTKRGYLKLFRESGFLGAETYWAEPGYNQPYHLIPVDSKAVASSLTRDQGQVVRGVGLSWAARAKRLLARMGVLKHFVPEFVFILSGHEATPGLWSPRLPPLSDTTRRIELRTHPFAAKTTLLVDGQSQPGIVIKCSTPAPRSREVVATEYADLRSVTSVAGERGAALPFLVPIPLGSIVLGNVLMTAESRAVGEALSDLLMGMPSDKRLPFLHVHLAALGETSSLISGILQGRGRTVSVSDWLRYAKGALDERFGQRVEQLADRYASSSGHGDFTAENIVLEANARRAAVIDWEFVRDGVPPLFDLFTLFFSLLRFVPVLADASDSVEDQAIAQFYAAFFHANAWSAAFAATVRRECVRLGLDPSETWQLFVDTMILRIGYLTLRKSSIATTRIRCAEAMLAWEDRFQL